MPQIVPAILEETKEGFLEKLNLIMKIPNVDRVQVDFGDGIFIPKKLLSISDIDVLNPAVHWEAHLMIKKPEDFLDYSISGFNTIIIHYEAFERAEEIKQALSEIRKLGMKSGLAINPNTPVHVAGDFTGEADMFLVMGVTPGKQGQSFIPETLKRALELRNLIPNAIIEVDGGVNLSNVKQVAEASVNLIVAGSAIVGQGNPSENYEKLVEEAGRN